MSAEMSSSLEDLLEEEGFKGRRSMAKARSSFKAEAASMSCYDFRDEQKTASALGHRHKTERARSDGARYSLKGKSPTDGDIRVRRPRDNLIRTQKDEGLKKESRERVSRNLKEGKTFRANLPKYMQQNEIEEVGLQNDERFLDINLNKAYSSERGMDKYSEGAREKEGYKEKSRRGTKVENRNGNNLAEKLLGHLSFGANNGKTMKKSTASYDTSSNRSSWNSKNSDDNQGKKRDKFVQLVSQPALDEVSVQALVSIVSGNIKCFLTDEDFRTTLRHNCFSSLGMIGLEEGQSTESKVMSSLEQAIETVEIAAEDSSSATDLKKASLQLSVITGLYSSNSKNGFTSGVPNSHLAACAHLYLSVIYKIQKKDRISAKHLLQVFCDVPFQARTILLPELWDHLFSPHLSHLKAWYNQQADSIADTPSRPKKLKLLEKMYNEILDTSTYQFAVYYKDWLTEGVEAPPSPLIDIPSVSVWGAHLGSSLDNSSELSSSMGPTQPMVSKKLYDAVFGCLSTPEMDETDDSVEADNFNDSMRSSSGSAVVKETITYSSETIKYTNKDIEEDLIKSVLDNAFLPANELSSKADKEWRLDGAGGLLESDLDNEIGDSTIWKETTGNINMPDASAVHAKANDELTLKSLAKSIFELKHPEASIDVSASSLSNPSEASTFCSLANPIKIRSSVEGLHESYKYFDERYFFSSIPHGFICPLTGKLFEDPVTLETGETFERVAIKAWFHQGNRKCPVTGKTLKSLGIPLTNFVLKRVIDNWRSEHCKHLLDFASQVIANSGRHGLKHLDETVTFILEQLLTAFSEEEKRTNVKHIISLGGLHFLLQRFELGKLEEKACVVALLSCCIEADASCRNRIASNINKQCLLELLQSKQLKSSVVLLLTELICLKRWKDVTLFLSGLHNEGIVNTMDVLLEYLQSSPKDQRPLVAVLLLLLALVVETQKYSIYKEEAIDAITVALEDSVVDEKVREKCNRAFLILGGRFSFSGKLLTENWILKNSVFEDICEVNSLDSEYENLVIHDTVSSYDEEQANEEWLTKLSAALLGNRKKSFLDTISKCLGSGNLKIVRICLTTVVWLSCALSSQSNAEFQISAFLALIPRLKESLENCEQIDHRILASISLLNFSKISECRVLLMTIAEEIAAPLESLAEVTWTAKQLYAIIAGGRLQSNRKHIRH